MATYSANGGTAKTTMTVRMHEHTKARLEKLAQHTHRTKSFLANVAIADYVERELAIIEGVQRGLADMEAGRVTSHNTVMAELDALIDDAEKANGEQ